MHPPTPPPITTVTLATTAGHRDTRASPEACATRHWHNSFLAGFKGPENPSRTGLAGASEARDVPRGNRAEAGYQLCFSKRERRETQEDDKIRQRVSAQLQAGDGGAARKPRSCLSGRCRGRRPWSAGPGRIQTWRWRTGSARCRGRRRTTARCSPGCARETRPEFSPTC